MLVFRPLRVANMKNNSQLIHRLTATAVDGLSMTDFGLQSQLKSVNEAEILDRRSPNHRFSSNEVKGH